MKMQLSKRLGVAHVRDTVMQLVTGEIEFAQAMAELQVGKTRLYELKASFLAAHAVSYRWTLNGVAVVGGEDGDFVVEWEKAKSGVTETYAVTPVYDVCGTAVDGEPLTATVEFIPDGSLLLFR